MTQFTTIFFFFFLWELALLINSGQWYTNVTKIRSKWYGVWKWEDVQDVFWTSYACSIYVLCLGGRFIFANVIVVLVGYFTYFKSTHVLFIWCSWWMFFSSIKGIKRLISKEMSKLLLIKLTFSKFPFSKFKKFVTRSVFG